MVRVGGGTFSLACLGVGVGEGGGGGGGGGGGNLLPLKTLEWV